jgi:hypothetical protein
MVVGVGARVAGENTFDLLTGLSREAFTVEVDAISTGKHWYRLRLRSPKSDGDRQLVFRDIGPNILTVTPDVSSGVLEVVWADTGNTQWSDEFVWEGSPTNGQQLSNIYELFFWEPQHQTNLLSVWNSSTADDWWRDVRLLRGSDNLTFMVEEFFTTSSTFVELGTRTVGCVNTLNPEHVKRITMHVGNELARGVYFLDREPVVGSSSPIPGMPGDGHGAVVSNSASSFGGAQGSAKYSIPPMPGESDDVRVAVAGWWGTKSNGKG